MLSLSIRRKGRWLTAAWFWTSPPDVEAATRPFWEKVKTRVTPIEWRAHAPLIAEINRLKKEKNAVILAHNYMTPEIFHGVGDFVGDSLGLAREAARTDARVIVQAGVHFMAETSKVLCPDKTVLIPDLRAGCSLAASITAADVRLIKAALSGHAGRHLREHHRRGEGRDRRLLHQRQRRAGGGSGGRRGRDRPRDPAAGRVPGPQRRAPDRHPHHRLARPLRGARALRRRGHPPGARKPGPTPRSSPTPSARPRCSSWSTSPARRPR